MASAPSKKSYPFPMSAYVLKTGKQKVTDKATDPTTANPTANPETANSKTANPTANPETANSKRTNLANYRKILLSYRQLIQQLSKRFSERKLRLIRSAFRLANRAHRNQFRLSGEPYITHPLAVAHILAEQNLDAITISAGLLHDVVEDTKLEYESIREQFGEKIHSLVKAVTKISALKNKKGRSEPEVYTRLKNQEEAENIRLILTATIQDPRVILIKLADKLHNMRTLQYHRDEKIHEIAHEALNLYAPIAGRLGMFRIKSQLEDLAFLHLQPKQYYALENNLEQSRDELRQFINTIRTILNQRLKKVNIEARVEGRAKHIYSIHQKMNNKYKDLKEIYDLRGVRIITKEIRDCYSALGVAHTIWPPIDSRFKDYIALPKSNGYQSLHTTVMGPDGKPLEIQIRTEAMNEIANYGVAAHWHYKEKQFRQFPPERLKWLDRLDHLMETPSNLHDFIEDLRSELTSDDIYVFTPKGDVIDLPVGSTILDMAFRIHTEIGYRARIAKVNNHTVPLRYELKSGDRVEIITDPDTHPSPYWQNYLKSPRARQKLRAYFRREQEKRAIYLEKSDPLGEREERGEESGNSIGRESSGNVNDQLRGLKEIRIRRRKTQDPRRVPIEVAGARKISLRYANCCSPIPGDKIIAFITAGPRLEVHRASCHVVEEAKRKKETVVVEWEGLTEKYPVPIEVIASDRKGLYLDMVGGISKAHSNILRAEATFDRNNNKIVRSRFLIEVEHVDHLNDVLDNLQSLPGVLEVKRDRN